MENKKVTKLSEVQISTPMLIVGVLVLLATAIITGYNTYNYMDYHYQFVGMYTDDNVTYDFRGSKTLVITSSEDVEIQGTYSFDNTTITITIADKSETYEYQFSEDNQVLTLQYIKEDGFKTLTRVKDCH